MLGMQIKKYRTQRGWTQRDLARWARVDHAWISRLESGERHNLSLNAAMRLAVALGVSLDVLAQMPGAREGICSCGAVASSPLV